VIDIARPFEQIAFVAGEAIAVRDAGFTTDAFAFPRDEAGMLAICAFNNCPRERAPRGWHYYPNAGTKKAWERVIAAIADRNPKGGNEVPSRSDESADPKGIAKDKLA
jgi:hypothetical protein